jgi:hypothetical protein
MGRGQGRVNRAGVRLRVKSKARQADENLIMADLFRGALWKRDVAEGQVDDPWLKKAILPRVHAYLNRALEIYRPLAAASPSQYLPRLAGTLDRLTLVHQQMGNIEAAESFRTESTLLWNTIQAMATEKTMARISLGLWYEREGIHLLEGRLLDDRGSDADVDAGIAFSKSLDCWHGVPGRLRSINDLLDPRTLMGFHIAACGLLSGRVPDAVKALDELTNEIFSQEAPDWRNKVGSFPFRAVERIMRGRGDGGVPAKLLDEIKQMKQDQEHFEIHYMESQNDRYAAAQEIRQLYNMVSVVGLVCETIQKGAPLNQEGLSIYRDMYLKQVKAGLQDRAFDECQLFELFWLCCWRLLENPEIVSSAHQNGEIG